MRMSKSILAGTIMTGAVVLHGDPGNAQPKLTDHTPTSEAIRPFTINISEDAVTDLQRRILATRWPQKENVADQSQGVQLGTMQKLANYWVKDYD